jgi:hypothetical protein
VIDREGVTVAPTGGQGAYHGGAYSRVYLKAGAEQPIDKRGHSVLCVRRCSKPVEELINGVDFSGRDGAWRPWETPFGCRICELQQKIRQE